VLAPAPLDLNEVVRGLVPMLSRLIGEDVRIAMLAGAELPQVLADRAQVEQVIINLAINARDAMPGGGTLSIETSGSGDGFVCLSVTDTGTGIAPELVERIFEPFFTTKEVGLGTGLGLATVHGIVTQSGGRVRVSSDVGHGSTFSVYLPGVEPVEVDAPGDARAVSSERLGGDETILLCEDDESVRRLAVVFLAAQGYTVVSCGSPGEALEAARARSTRWSRTS
jgi:two-component system cell cycle sensor histidine kinase/response regulator CckA